MFSLIKQLFISLLSISKSFSTKCMFLNDNPCMVRPTLINLNPVELRHHPFMIIFNKYTNSCYVLCLF